MDEGCAQGREGRHACPHSVGTTDTTVRWAKPSTDLPGRPQTSTSKASHTATG